MWSASRKRTVRCKHNVPTSVHAAGGHVVVRSGCVQFARFMSQPSWATMKMELMLHMLYVGKAGKELTSTASISIKSGVQRELIRPRSGNVNELRTKFVDFSRKNVAECYAIFKSIKDKNIPILRSLDGA